MSLIAAARARLRSVFGFDGFRPGQEAIVRAVLDGEDVLAVMPTGSGKSLCYQLPAVAGSGLTVVVSPLIALMRDQVSQLRALGVEAASLNSANEAAEARETHRAARERSLRLLYVAPERLALDGTIALLREAGAARLAIDEAHCVSEWGHDFRPEYLRLGDVRQALGGVPVAAFTATADASTRADILAKLFPAAAPRVFIHGFDRPNIRLAMSPKRDPGRQVAAFVGRYRGLSGIVYCATRRRVEETAALLADAGHRALPYHAGMDKEARGRNQDLFQQEDGVVVVATVAFGMGIDKPDVRFVCHADMPRNVESYYQEIGRAGRDGLPADALALYGLADMQRRRRLIEESDAPDQRKRIERQRFNALVALCEAPSCRRQALLRYFGEEAGPCGNCDLCAEGVRSFDGGTEARKLMSAMLRTGERFGTEHLVHILRGEATENVTRWGHQRLPTFGVGADRDAGQWRAIVRQLYALGLVGMDIAGHGRWFVTEDGRRVLFGKDPVPLRADALEPAGGGKGGKGRRTRAQRAAEGTLDDDAAAMLAALKRLRTQLAKAQGVPAYVVFPDRTLIEMATARPATLAGLREIHGIGEAKLKRFGAAFLAVLNGHDPEEGT